MNIFRILLLVDSLTNPRDPVPKPRHNLFVYRPMSLLAGKHRVDWPLLAPRFPGLVKLFYRLRGRKLHFPGPVNGKIGKINPFTVKYNFLPRIYPAQKTRALLKKIRQREPDYDLIHCHTVFDLGLAGLELRKAFGWPLVVTVYGTDVNWLFEEAGRRASPEIAGATRRVLNEADRVICVSRDLADKVQSLGTSRDKIHWIPNGVDTSLFTPGCPGEERKKLGWPENAKVILFVGHIYETKGVGDLVEAVSEIEKRGERVPDYLVKIAGFHNEYEQKLIDAVTKRELESKIEFLGPQPYDKVPALMRACDILCLPSWREGWPLVLVEAMACGRPVVAASTGGIPEIVTGPELGILCQPRNPPELAGALIKALDRQWDSGLIVAHADNYSYDKIVRQIENIYREVLEEKRPFKE
ncbi:MAG: glycosyltransferase [Deltaproteobacteria bacterium]|nr:glycosyltransferase [Deltaproteobacteria bacterium]